MFDFHQFRTERLEWRHGTWVTSCPCPFSVLVHHILQRLCCRQKPCTSTLRWFVTSNHRQRLTDRCSANHTRRQLVQFLSHASYWSVRLNPVWLLFFGKQKRLKDRANRAWLLTIFFQKNSKSENRKQQQPKTKFHQYRPGTVNNQLYNTTRA